MMTLRPDLPALAAQLRLMAYGLVAELMDWVGAQFGVRMLAAGLRRRMARDLAQLERFAAGIVVLMALKTLPARLPRPPAARARSTPRAALRA